MQVDRTENGYRLKQTYDTTNVYMFITIEEAIELSQRFDRDFEQDLNDEEIQYQAEMVRRAKAIGL